MRAERSMATTQAGLFGIAIGIVGAILDFYSGYQINAQSMSTASDMATGSVSPGLAWGVGIIALGVVLLVTSVGSAVLPNAVKMKDLGALMIVYGLTMLFIGASMYSGLAPMMNGALFPAIGMLVVGALMIANGAFMRRSKM